METQLRIKTSRDLTHQDFKNIKRLFFPGEDDYSVDYIRAIALGTRPSKAIIQKAIDFYLGAKVNFYSEIEAAVEKWKQEELVAA